MKDGPVEIKHLCPKKHGRPCLLGDALDAKLQTCLKQIHEEGGSVSSRIVKAALASL